MLNSHDTLAAAAMEMRWRTLSLAADLDRIERAEGGGELLENDPMIGKLRKALRVLIDGKSNRAEQVQMIFSDVTAPPSYQQPTR